MNQEQLENELQKQTTRAERWKSLAASFHAGMAHIFQQYEREIDGHATPTINTGGLYRCCVEAIKELIKSDREQIIKLICCDKCGETAELTDNEWKRKENN